MYIVSSVVLLSVAALDRFCLKRRKVDIQGLEFIDVKGEHLRFSLKFSIKQRLLQSEVTYTLRDKNNPRTVISGKARTLEFSAVGMNEEYLLLPKKLQNAPGAWVLDVKVSSAGSRLNPLYKILPIETHITKEFHLE